MNRLQSELHRLYLPCSAADEPETTAPGLIGPSETVRAMVMELAAPPTWEVLAAVWQGVQTELELPAPAIAVSGVDGLQLWFSLVEAIPVEQAHRFLQALRVRYLPDIKASRVRLMPASVASVSNPERHARLVPACQEITGNWSAFVAPDLAPVFSDTPWIDIPPNEDGQAALLRGLEAIKPAAFDAALLRLGSSPPQTLTGTAAAGVQSQRAQEGSPTAAALDAKQFLLQVMNDDTVALALRVDAAKALLQQRD